jgi:LysR family transcriptional regulator, chromosome initiation inhibitor
VSQRVRALEIAIGRPVLRRVRPVEMTPAGEAVVRFARQLELLSVDLSDQLEPSADGSTPRITLVVNADSLHTWALPGLVEVAEHVQLTILREDQDHSLDLVRRGAAHGAVTATAAPVSGCVSRPLGVMRYRPVCTPAFAARWFADGVTSTTLSTAPVVIYDDKDDLQDRYLRRQRRTALQPPRHYVRLPTNSAKPFSLDSVGECCPNCSSHNWSPECSDHSPRQPTSTCPCTGSSGASPQPR